MIDQSRKTVSLLSVEDFCNSLARLPRVPSSQVTIKYWQSKDCFQVSKHSKLNDRFVNAVLLVDRRN